MLGPSLLRLLRTTRWRDVWSGLQAAGWVLLAVRWWHFVTVPASDPDIAVDTYTYWSAPMDEPYGLLAAERGAYLYSPAFLHAIAPLRLLPFDLVWPIWVALNLGAATYCVGPFASAVLSFFPPLSNDIHIGNVFALMAAALALSARWPAAWAFLVLTKVTVGVGALWFALRGEWRRFAIAVGATVGIAALSALLAPDAWVAWFEVLLSSSERGGLAGLLFLASRLALAVLLLAYGAWRNMPIVVPIAATLAVPIPWGASVIMLLAVPRWIRHTSVTPAARSPRRVATPV